LFVKEEQQNTRPPLHLSLTPAERWPSTTDEYVKYQQPPALQCVVYLLKRDGVNKQSNASMDKSFDGMHENYDFDSIRFSVKKTISISMIVTSVQKCHGLWTVFKWSSNANWTRQ